MLDSTMHDELAAELVRAQREAILIHSLTERHPGIDVADAYQIQLINIRRRVAEGAWVAGHTVGTPCSAQPQLPSEREAEYGHLLEDMRASEGIPVRTRGLVSPRVEARVGLILSRDLSGPSCTADDVLSVTAAYVPAIVVLDARIKNRAATTCDSIADNASCVRWLIGETRLIPGDFDTRTIDATVTCNGAVVAKGQGDGVFGSPLIAAAWLAERVHAFGVQLKAGDVVLIGNGMQTIDASSGDHFVADFDQLGSVRLDFD
jgi:2-keto-4-pentenoate hydratase